MMVTRDRRSELRRCSSWTRTFLATTMLADAGGSALSGDGDRHRFRVVGDERRSPMCCCRAGGARARRSIRNRPTRRRHFFGLRLDMIPRLRRRARARRRRRARQRHVDHDPARAADTSAGGTIRMTPVPLPEVAVAIASRPQEKRSYSMIIEQNATSIAAATAQMRDAGGVDAAAAALGRIARRRRGAGPPPQSVPELRHSERAGRERGPRDGQRAAIRETGRAADALRRHGVA